MPALVCAVIAVSFAAVFFRKAAPTHPLIASAVRLSIASVLLFPGVVLSYRSGRLTARMFRFSVAAGLFYGLHFGAWVTSLTLTSVAASVTLVCATPLLLALATRFTGHDRPERRHWIAILVAMVGLSIIGGHDLGISTKTMIGDGLALLGAVAMAGYLLVARRLGESLDLWAFSGIATGIGAIALFSGCLLVGIPVRVASVESFAFLFLAALVPQLIGHNLLTWSCRYLRPTVVGMATVGEPVGASLLAWVLLGETIPILVGIGCTITLVAVSMALWERDNRKRGDLNRPSITPSA